MKTIIGGQASGQPSISLSFFEERKDAILKMAKMIHPSLDNLDSITINGYYDIAVKEYKSVYPVDIDPSSALTKKRISNMAY